MLHQILEGAVEALHDVGILGEDQVVLPVHGRIRLELVVLVQIHGVGEGQYEVLVVDRGQSPNLFVLRVVQSVEDHLPHAKLGEGSQFLVVDLSLRSVARAGLVFIDDLQREELIPSPGGQHAAEVAVTELDRHALAAAGDAVRGLQVEDQRVSHLVGELHRAVSLQDWPSLSVTT